MTYAAADVTHLHTAYLRLRERLEREGRSEWVLEEMEVLTRPETYRADPEAMWERLRPRTGNRRMLGVLRAAAAWREREAQRVNIPRQRLLRDESLLEVAATAPATAEALARCRGITRGFAEGRAAPGCWPPSPPQPPCRRTRCPMRRGAATGPAPRPPWCRC